MILAPAAIPALAAIEIEYGNTDLDDQPVADLQRALHTAWLEYRHRATYELDTEDQAWTIGRVDAALARHRAIRAEIIDAYQVLHTDFDAHTPVRIADLRAVVLDATYSRRRLFDQAIEALGQEKGVHVRTEADRKRLTRSDREAAVTLAGTPRHHLLIEA